MIIATFQHPCPYFDDSYAVNSQNCGPYGDAIMTKLIPYIEEHFRVIQKPYYEGTFHYGRPRKGHGWNPYGYSTGELQKKMAEHIQENAPPGENTRLWNY